MPNISLCQDADLSSTNDYEKSKSCYALQFDATGHLKETSIDHPNSVDLGFASSKRFDRDSGCPVSDRSHKQNNKTGYKFEVDGKILHESKMGCTDESSSSDEQSRLHGYASSLARPNPLKQAFMLEKHPKFMTPKGQHDTKRLYSLKPPSLSANEAESASKVHSRKKSDLYHTLNRIQRDLEVLKTNLKKPGEAPLTSLKGSSSRSQKRTPVKAVLEFSCTSGSDSESSVSKKFNASMDNWTQDLRDRRLPRNRNAFSEYTSQKPSLASSLRKCHSYSNIAFATNCDDKQSASSQKNRLKQKTRRSRSVPRTSHSRPHLSDHSSRICLRSCPNSPLPRPP